MTTATEMQSIEQRERGTLELSVVMPCLNEADTLETCLRKAFQVIEEEGLEAEVIVADNGSTDGSIEIARRCGARVVAVTERGYGSALTGGITASKGRFVVMGDADDSYDFLELGKFVRKLREGYDLVMGCRLPGGGGTVAQGAMPWSHRYIGNPLFTRLVRSWFRAPIHDVYCGLRGFTRAWFDRLDLRASGMIFATEMVIKSSLFGARIAEVPITLHPDGRKSHAPHLKTFQDGWRTLRFFVLYSPRWLFFVPGLLLTVAGALIYGIVYARVPIGGALLDAHSLLVGSLLVLMGYQAILFGGFAKVFAVGENLLPLDNKLRRWLNVFTLERGLLAGGLGFLAGFGVLGAAFWQWSQVDFGRLDYSATMRLVIPGILLAALGFQTVMASFFFSVLGMRRK